MRSRPRSYRRNHSLFQRFSKDLSHVVDEHKANVFEGLFRDLVEGTYINRLESSIQEKGEIQYVGEQVDGSRAAVKTNVVTRRNQQVPIEYRLQKADGRWLIYDVLVEGISLVNNYRSQFNRIITSSSYNDLVQKMKNRQGDELSGSPQRKVQ